MEHRLAGGRSGRCAGSDLRDLRDGREGRPKKHKGFFGNLHTGFCELFKSKKLIYLKINPEFLISYQGFLKFIYFIKPTIYPVSFDLQFVKILVLQLNYQQMQLLLSFSGIILSAILIYFNAHNNKSTIYLGISFLLASMNSFTYYALLFSGSVTLTAIVILNTGFIPLLGGPILYFYIRSVLNDDHQLKKQDLWHLVPVFIYLASVSPYLMSSWTYKTEVAGIFISALNSQDHMNTAFLGNKFLVYFVFILSKVLFLAYVLWSTGLLFSFLKNKRDQEVFFRLQPTLRWLKAFLYILIMLATAHILFMIKIFAFGDLTSFTNIKTIQNLLGIGPIVIVLYTFFTPEILYGLPRIPANRKEIKFVDRPTNMGNPVKRTTQKQLERHYLQSIGQEANGYMEKFMPYTNPEFSLAELSVMLHLPMHHLAYYLNEEKKQSFTHYRNEWRVRHAKNLIKEGKNREMTLEAVGLLSGFPNRDSFREAFHRIEGVTPAVFVAQCKE